MATQVGMVDMSDSSALRALQQGLQHAQRAHYGDALGLFMQAHAALLGTQSQLLLTLEAYIDSHRRFWDKQEALHLASKHFAHAQAEHLALLTELEQVLTVSDNLADVLPISPSELPNSPGGLQISCFGRFSVQCAGQPLVLCRNRSGQTILRILCIQPQHRIQAEVLMDALWPEDAPDVARHKLHVAVSALRQSLQQGGLLTKARNVLSYVNECYELSSELQFQIDVDLFEAAYQAGKLVAPGQAVEQYSRACRLYKGPLLPEDMYADWAQIRREQLTLMFLDMCAVLADAGLQSRRYNAAIHWASRILEENRCDETAYAILIRAYAGSGRRAEALRQFQRCKKTLYSELGVEPVAELCELAEALMA